MFAQPWAWLGLLGLAVPVAIHLLARHQAVRALFPSLRFIDVTELSAIRRHRLSDVPLLLVRLAIVTAAVAALAGPRWPMSTGAAGATALAVVVDASAGVTGDAGPTAARAAVQGAVASVIVEAESLPAGIESATAWLSRQPGRRELLVISDFQRGALDAPALARVPAGVGIRFQSLPLFAAKTLDGFERRGDRARMTWPVAPSGVPLPLTVRAGSAQARADAMLDAVASLVITSPVDATARRATMVFRTAADFAALKASATPIDQQWMYGAVRPLLQDPALRTHITASASGGELMVLVDDDPDGIVAASATSAVLNALLQPIDWAEFEPEAIPAVTLRGWERAPSDAPGAESGEPQGRWLWVLVLMLMALETWMRRQRMTAASEEEVHARVA